jgi:hypothetical protein
MPDPEPRVCVGFGVARGRDCPYLAPISPSPENPGFGLPAMRSGPGAECAFVSGLVRVTKKDTEIVIDCNTRSGPSSARPKGRKYGRKFRGRRISIADQDVGRGGWQPVGGSQKREKLSENNHVVSHDASDEVE